MNEAPSITYYVSLAKQFEEAFNNDEKMLTKRLLTKRNTAQNENESNNVKSSTKQNILALNTPSKNSKINTEKREQQQLVLTASQKRKQTSLLNVL